MLSDDASLAVWDEVSEVIKAPSVVEMFDLLPLSITDENGMPYYLTVVKREDSWFIGYHLAGEDYFLIEGKDESLPNALAKVLIELVREGFITFSSGEVIKVAKDVPKIIYKTVTYNEVGEFIVAYFAYPPESFHYEEKRIEEVAKEEKKRGANKFFVNGYGWIVLS